MIALLLVGQALAEDLLPLDLTTVLTSVETLHPLIAAESTRVDAAEGEVLAARGGFDPVFKEKLTWTPTGYYSYVKNAGWVEQPTAAWGTTLFAGWDLGVGEIPAYDGEYETPPLGEIYAGVDVPLLRDGPIDRRRQAIGKAKLEVDAAEASVQVRTLDLLRQSVYRYADWVAAGQRLHVAEGLLALAETRDAQFRGRESVGDLAAFDRKDNERLVVQRRGRQIEARRAFEKAQLDLSLFLRDAEGRPLLAPLDAIPDAFPDLGAAPPTPEAAALEQRPEFARLEAQRAQVAWDARLARNQTLPALDVLAQATVDPTGYEPVEVQVGLAIDVPIPMRTARGRADVASAGLSRIDLELTFQRDRVRADVADALSALQALDERITQLEAEHTLAHELEVGERRRYELGDSNLIFVNTREIATADADAAVIMAHAERLRAEADLRAAVGSFGVPAP